MAFLWPVQDRWVVYSRLNCQYYETYLGVSNLKVFESAPLFLRENTVGNTFFLEDIASCSGRKLLLSSQATRASFLLVRSTMVSTWKDFVICEKIALQKVVNFEHTSTGTVVYSLMVTLLYVSVSVVTLQKNDGRHRKKQQESNALKLTEIMKGAERLKREIKVGFDWWFPRMFSARVCWSNAKRLQKNIMFQKLCAANHECDSRTGSKLRWETIKMVRMRSF